MDPSRGQGHPPEAIAFQHGTDVPDTTVGGRLLPWGPGYPDSLSRGRRCSYPTQASSASFSPCLPQRATSRALFSGSPFHGEPCPFLVLPMACSLLSLLIPEVTAPGRLPLCSLSHTFQPSHFLSKPTPSVLLQVLSRLVPTIARASSRRLCPQSGPAFPFCH